MFPKDISTLIAGIHSSKILFRNSSAQTNTAMALRSENTK
jgi:hypothetical protein